MFESKSEESRVESEKPRIENTAEEIISPESLAEQKISEMQSGVVEFEKDGMEQVGDANNSIGLDVESVGGVQDELQINERMSGISGKAKELFKSAQSAMKKAVAIGMATMAFSGTAGENKEFNDELMDNSKMIERLRDSQENLKTISEERAEIMGEDEKNLVSEYKKSLEEAEEVEHNLLEAETLTRMENDPIINADKVKRELKKHIGSQEYLDKLKIECYGDADAAERIQKERLEYLEETRDLFIDASDMNITYAGLDNSIIDKKYIPQWLIKARLHPGVDNIGAFYRPSEKEVVLPNSRDDYSTRHELLHASTHSDSGITKKTEKILKEAYREIGTKEDRYLSRTTERLVRKQQLDYEMEKLGIKKYGEKFTQAHHDKLMELYKKNKLSQNAMDFIKTTKSEYFEQIFNDIADSEDKRDTIGHNVV